MESGSGVNGIGMKAETGLLGCVSQKHLAVCITIITLVLWYMIYVY